MILHPIAPVWDARSEVLILGSFPSVASREAGFYYGHPRNRFWKLLGLLFDETVPGDIAGKKEFLLRHRVALWDVIASCEITGSADSTIKNVTPNDLRPLLEGSRISRVCLNGGKAASLYKKYLAPRVPLPAFTLPSTSPANAAWSMERLEEAWKIVL